MINNNEKPIKTAILINIGCNVSKWKYSIFFNKSLLWTYQYDGKTWAIFNTISGNHVEGTKTPAKNADPNATTLTIPLTAFLSLTNELIIKAKVSEQNVKSKAFMI